MAGAVRAMHGQMPVLLALLVGLLWLSSEAQARKHHRGGGGRDEDHGGKEDEGVVFDKTTIPYCNYPNKISIPPLSEEAVGRVPGLRLLQVQAVARHGSRIPYQKYSCWDGYGFTWNCNVTEMSLPSPDDEGDDRPAPWIFRKVYDGSPTVLGGTCHLGQLVEEGFEQEAANGRALAEAYVGPGPRRLFAIGYLGSVKPEHIYLRSDDDPSFRTEMSGEFLLGGMFQAGAHQTLLWHTGDFPLDEIYPNDKVCPALLDVQREAWASREWLQVEGSAWVRRLNKRLVEEMPGYGWDHMLDCLGTTSCTDRPFPGKLTRETFDDAMEYSVARKTFPFHWNDAYYSKLAMGPFARELLQNLLRRASGESEIRFGLFLGHDTTILPLLCAWGVWDGAWPPYASMLAIELYEAQDAHRHYVRLAYQGRELVLPGCEAALCPLGRLEELTAPWALATDDPDRPCGSKAKAPAVPERARGSAAAKYMANPTDPTTKGAGSGSGEGGGGGGVGAGVFGALFGVALGAVLGAVATLAWTDRGRRADGGSGQRQRGQGQGQGRYTNLSSSSFQGAYDAGEGPAVPLSFVDRGRYSSI